MSEAANNQKPQQSRRKGTLTMKYEMGHATSLVCQPTYLSITCPIY
uniref:Uncharacterized protein n=1 Tax=Anguilla anguilla TaxID=7936 RepID=A0A0E9QGT5_ANGAN